MKKILLATLILMGTIAAKDISGCFWIDKNQDGIFQDFEDKFHAFDGEFLDARYETTIVNPITNKTEDYLASEQGAEVKDGCYSFKDLNKSTIINYAFEFAENNSSKPEYHTTILDAENNDSIDNDYEYVTDSSQSIVTFTHKIQDKNDTDQGHVDAGILPKVTSVSGLFWNDTDLSGERDLFEVSRFKHVKLKLISSEGNIVGETIVDENGTYEFADVDLNNTILDKVEARVTYDANDSIELTITNSGSSDNNDSDARLVSAEIGVITIYMEIAGNNPRHLDAGFKLGSIVDDLGLKAVKGFVWMGEDANSIKDENSSGFLDAGKVMLFAVDNGVKRLISDTQIDFSTGYYEMVYTTAQDETTELNREYLIEVGEINSKESTFGVISDYKKYTYLMNRWSSTEGKVTDSDAKLVSKVGEDTVGTPTISFNSNTRPLLGDADFGFYKAGYRGTKIGDLVWDDVNKNGIQDAGEKGIPNVYVELISTIDESFIDRRITGSKGHYLFDNLFTSNYKVRVVIPEGYSAKQTGSNEIVDKSTGSNSDIYSVDGENALSGELQVNKKEVIYTLDFGLNKDAKVLTEDENCSCSEIVEVEDKKVPNNYLLLMLLTMILLFGLKKKI